jgi:hypothetical protein
MPLLVLVLLVPLIFLALLPFLLIQRYRAGKARRQARPWVATVNIAVMTFSAVFFLMSAAFTTFWVPRAVVGATMGLAAGLLLGLLGLLVTRWEATPSSLHYTPNNLLVLLVTLIVTARVAYGLFRSFEVARAGMTGAALVDAFGVPQSLGAAGAVMGYYLAYNIGLRWRIRRWERRALRRL